MGKRAFLKQLLKKISAKLGAIRARKPYCAIAQGACLIPTPPDDALVRASSLMRRYQDLPMDLADASLVILAEQLGEGRILSTDMRDFSGYRWKNKLPFTNLLLP